MRRKCWFSSDRYAICDCLLGQAVVSLMSVTSLTLSFIFVVPSYFACLLEMLENFYA